MVKSLGLAEEGFFRAFIGGEDDFDVMKGRVKLVSLEIGQSAIEPDCDGFVDSRGGTQSPGIAILQSTILSQILFCDHSLIDSDMVLIPVEAVVASDFVIIG